MNRANRKRKFSKYEVTIRREVLQVAVLTVEARSVEEAEETGLAVVDTVPASNWRSERGPSHAKAKVVRGG